MNNQHFRIDTELDHKRGMLQRFRGDPNKEQIVEREIDCLERTKLLPHANKIDQLIPYLANTLSLSPEEMHRVILALPTLSEFQIDELLNVLIDEASQFHRLQQTGKDGVQKLIAQAQERSWMKRWEDE